MKKALGLIEIEGLATTIIVADTMSKSANIEMIDIENTKGSGYMTIKVNGDVGAVNASVEAGKQVAISHGKLISFKVIPRPSEYVEMFFLKKDKEPKKVEKSEEKPEKEIKPEIVQEIKLEITETTSFKDENKKKNSTKVRSKSKNSEQSEITNTNQE